MFIDLTLAGDNALVIAMAVRSLPPRQQFWGRIGGTLGAVSLRVMFIAIVTVLFNIPLLRLCGGLALVWIAFKLVRPRAGDGPAVRHGASLLEAIGFIILADIIMSLDNVMAIAAAAHGDLVLVVFGLLLSLPLVVWGSGILARLMNRFPWIIWLGGGVLGYVAVDMIFQDHIVRGWLGVWADRLHVPVAVGLALDVMIMGWRFSRGDRASDPDGAVTGVDTEAVPP
ncbi:MAG: TerC family protein [Lentisphaerae bacterium]|nr:TerC family protein [Lentisphaerota bacterium]